MLDLQDFPLLIQHASTRLTGFVRNFDGTRSRRIFYRLQGSDVLEVCSNIVELAYGNYTIFGDRENFDDCSILLCYDAYGRLKNYAELDRQRFWEVHNSQPFSSEIFDIYPSCQYYFSTEAARNKFMTSLQAVSSGDCSEETLKTLRMALHQLIVEPVIGQQVYPEATIE